jgi:filamentous hemagglutinin
MALPGTLLPAVVLAQIAPLPGTSTQVIQTPNGLPQVNIAAPSAAGVSVNTYSQFDVHKPGAILNNSPTIVPTQQAGMINGNPNFGPGQAARIIVNQVNSVHPSQLRGFVEAGGNRAEVILANPAGIVVDGGGFINTSRATLTTGQPYYGADGSLAGYNVSRGLITVQGAGLNVSNVDQVDLISRAVQANAAIYAKTLNVVTGANQVNRDTLAAAAMAGDGPAPGVSIDVSQLGGMYANRIVLVGTEHGVGVSNAGVLAAQAGDLTLQTNGQLVLSGKTNATGHLSLAAHDGMRHSGTTYGQQGVTVRTSGRLNNSGVLHAQHNLGVNAGSVDSTGTLGAGVNQDGSVGHGSDLTVVASGSLKATGQNVAGGNVSLTGAGVDVSGSHTRALGNLELTAKAGDLQLTGASADAHGTLTATASGAVINDRGTLFSAAGTTVNARSVSNQGGKISARGPLTIETSEQVENQGGTLVTDGALKLIAGDIANHRGTIQSGGTLSVSGAALDNTAGRIASLNSDELSVKASGQLTNVAGTTATGARGGVIGGNGDVTVKAARMANRSLITANTNLRVTGQSIANEGGTLKAARNVTVDAGAHLTNDGGTIEGQTATLTGTTLDNSSGSVQADQVSLRGTDLVNHGGAITQTGSGAMTVDIGGKLDNSNGKLETKSENLKLAPARLVNDGGTIEHAGTGMLTLGSGTGSISNIGGKIVSNGQTEIRTGTLDNADGVISSEAGLDATASGTLNNANGRLLSKTDLNVTSGSLTNDGGSIGANSNVTIRSGSLTNQNGSIRAPNVSATIGATLDNSGGKLEADELALTAANLTNRGGTITHYGASPMTVAVSGTLDNSSDGVIQTNGTDLTLAPAELNNSGGTITHRGTGTLTLTSDGGASALNNASGKIVTKGQADITAGSLDNSSGTLEARRGVTGNVAGDVNNTQGLVRSDASLSLTNGGALVNRGGRIQAGQSSSGDLSALDIQSASIDNADGSINDLGTGKMTVQGGSHIVNSHEGGASGLGVITGNGDVNISASSIANTLGGQLSGANLRVQGTTLDNSGGVIGNVEHSTGDVDVTMSGPVTNKSGQISSTRDLTVTAATLLGGGEYSATHDAKLNLQGNFAATSDIEFKVGHDLALTLPGTFTNNANLQAVHNLSVDAGYVVNHGAMSAGSLLRTHSVNVTNTGTIVGGSASLAADGTVSNVGPSALIGGSDSNGLLEILAHKIENRDDTTATDTMAQTAIVGLGKVVLAGGKDASGNYTNAALVDNASALIQSGGDMELHADKVTNTRRVMKTSGYADSVDPALLEQFGISMSGRTGQVGVKDPTSIGGVYTEPPHGGQWNSSYQYTTYTGTAIANTVTETSPAAQIVSGGKIDAKSVGTLQNYWSNVAAVGNAEMPANYDADGWKATGQQAPGVRVTYSGQYHYNNYDNTEHDWQMPFGDAPLVGSRPGGYTQKAPADVRPYKLPGYDATLGSNGTMSGTGVTINNTAANAWIPPLGLLPGQAVPGLTFEPLNGRASGTTTVGAMLSETVTGSGAPSATVNSKPVVPLDPVVASATAQNVLVNLTIPQGGLFKPSPAPNASYVIETNPAFTSHKKFLSSDYFFQQIGVDLTYLPKRLGDGFYEQQLVRNQITSLTGKAVLGPYTDIQLTYESLLAAGAAQSKALDLSPGARLSADQASKLTNNVIIMETRMVDGQSVLVPVVYLAKVNQQNMSNGPLITATDIDIKDAQSFTNSGTVKADNALSIQAKQIDDAFGSLQSGGRMSLATAGNIDFTSAKVKAESLFVGAGGDLILNTATNTLKQTSDSGATRVATTLGPTARVDVAGDAAIITGGNFRQNAGELSVGGNFGALIGGDWTLGAQQVGEHKVVQRANGVSDTDINRVVGSTVEVDGVSIIGVGGDLTARGAQIELGQGGTIVAKGNVSLGMESATSTVNSSSSGSDRHGSYAETLHTSDQALIGTTLTGGNTVNIASGKDVTVSGSTISLDKGKANVSAAGDVNVGAASEAHVLNSHETHSHGSVVSSTKVASGIDQGDTISHGSLVSADAVSITSGRDINVTGSAVVGTGDVSLDATRHVNILAAENRSDLSAYYDQKHSGVMGSGGLGFTLGTAEQKAQSDNHVVQQSQQRSTVGAVQGNVSIKAGENVHIGGSDVVTGKVANDTANATGNIQIAGQNVTIDPSQDDARAHDQQESKSRGVTVAVTGTPLDAVRNVRDNASSGNGFQRAQGVMTEVGASMADVPSISVTAGRSENKSATDMLSLTHAGSTIRGAGDVSIIATGGAEKDAQGQAVDGDIAVMGSSISAGGKTLLGANRDVTLAASTDRYQQSTQETSSSTSIALISSPSLGNLTRWISGTANNDGVGPSPYNASRANADGSLSETRQRATVVSGDSVTVLSRTGDLNVTGSGVSATHDVKLRAEQGAINVMAGLETSTSHQESSSRQIGSLGSNGTSTGFSVGVANSRSVQDHASQTRSTTRSQIASASGNVTLDAKKDVTVVGADLMAGEDLTLVGENLQLDPGTDTTQSSESQHSSQFGVSLALGGAAGNAAAAANQSMRNPARGGDSRLGALDKAQAALTAYNATKVAEAVNAGKPTAQPLVKATVSVGGGTSSSESSSNSRANTGSTLTAGGNVTLIATGSGATDANGLATDGDIDARGTRISGKNVSLDAARDLNLQSAKDTTELSSSNSSGGGNIGVGAGLGGQQNGFTLELGASGAQGHANGQSVTNRDTQISASDTLSLKSGRDTNLRGAQVAGKRVETDVGRDLTIQSQQDTATYDSKQTSGGFQASICVPPFCFGQTVNGSGNVSQQNITATYASVNQQSGIYAGGGGYDVHVGNHTQLDGGAIASTASEDKNHLSTQSFGYTNLDNKASYSGDALGFGASGAFGKSTPTRVTLNTPLVQAGPAGPGPMSSNGLGPSGFSAAGTSSDEAGTTYASVSPGAVTVRGDADTGHDSTAGLNRDPETANGAVKNTFDAQKMQNDLSVQQTGGQVGMQVVGNVAKHLGDQAVEAKKQAEQDYRTAAAAHDEAGMAKAQTAMGAADQKIAFWGDDGAGRIGAHMAVSGVAAALGGGNVPGAVSGTAAGDLAGTVVGTLTDATLGGALLTNVALGAAGAAAGGVSGGASGALSGAGAALNADRFNRQLHDEDKAQTKRLAVLSKEKGLSYAEGDIANQQALMDLAVGGKTYYGENQVATGEKPQDGTDWSYYGQNVKGEPVWAQDVRRGDPDLQAFIASNTNGKTANGMAYEATTIGKNPGLFRMPDLVNFQVDYFVGSVWGTFTRDGNSYFGYGLNKGIPNSVGAGVNISGGYLNTMTARPGQTNKFAEGYAGGGSALYGGLGGGVMVSPGNGTATVIGVGAGTSLGKIKNPVTAGGGFSVDQGKTGVEW